MDWAWKLALFLWPPDSGDKAVDRWRKLIAMTVWLNTIFIITMLLGAADRLPFVSGFAQKSDMDDLKLMITENDLPDAIIASCDAWRDGDRVKISLTGSQLAKLLSRYEHLAGVKYPLAECRANLKEDQ